MLTPCPFCDGKGAQAFETGPPVELCSQCGGTGRLVRDWRGMFAALAADKGVFLDADMRLLLAALADLEERVVALERRDA